MRIAVRTLLATSALVAAASAAMAQVAPQHLAIEGGLACSRNKSVEKVEGRGIGQDGCGGTGAIEFGRTGAPVVSVFDHWAIRGRYTAFDDDQRIFSGGNDVAASFTDRRFVLDAELGLKFSGPLNLATLFGGTSRLVVGLRYAAWRGNLSASVLSGPDAGDSAAVRMDTVGAGPRIGMRSSIPIGQSFLWESRSGVAALYARHKASEVENGLVTDRAKDTNWVFSVETSSALTYKIDGVETGRLVSLGLFSEYWFHQTHIDDVKRNRHSWGPFLRVTLPMQ